MEIPTKKPVVGQMVRYVPQPGTHEAANNASVIPAVVVAVWSDGSICNLKAFTDSTDAPVWVPSAKYDSTGKEPRSFHFGE